MTRNIEILSTLFLGLAILHTFTANRFTALAHHAVPGSIRANLFHVLGEVEIVFGIWAGIFIGLFALLASPEEAIRYMESVDFTEAAFVFVIMAVAATRSIQTLAVAGIEVSAKIISRSFPWISPEKAFYLMVLILGPLLGSLITEPAAMTVSALILSERFFKNSHSSRFKYKTLALLFVNISIGGVLTHFAAPPVVMVAKTWGWNSSYMFTHFGYKALIAVVINTVLTLFFLRKEFEKMERAPTPPRSKLRTPIWIPLVHILFLLLVIYTAHHMVVFLGLFLLFLGVVQITEAHQDRLKIRESMLVGFFLGGIILLGRPQSWWLTPLITSLSEVPLYLGTTALTAITDNAALTYLGSQVSNISDPLKYALVAGAVSGGGLTIIANAPNPAGYAILKDSFGTEGVKPGRLFIAALVPTLIAMFCFELL